MKSDCGRRPHVPRHSFRGEARHPGLDPPQDRVARAFHGPWFGGGGWANRQRKNSGFELALARRDALLQAASDSGIEDGKPAPQGILEGRQADWRGRLPFGEGAARYRQKEHSGLGLVYARRQARLRSAGRRPNRHGSPALQRLLENRQGDRYGEWFWRTIRPGGRLRPCHGLARWKRCRSGPQRGRNGEWPELANLNRVIGMTEVPDSFGLLPVPLLHRP